MARNQLVAVLSFLAAAPQGVDAQAAAPVSVWLRTAPDSGEVYLSWSRLYPGPYTVRWRQAGADVWNEARAAQPSYTVAGLTNGQAHEFEVEADSLGVKLASPIVAETPGPRDDCSTSVPIFCSRYTFRRFAAGVLGLNGEPLCAQNPVGTASPQLPNCRYRVNSILASLNRYLGGRFVAPTTLPDTEFLRRVLRRTLWRRYDPALGGAPPGLVDAPYAEAGAVTSFSAVRRFILRDPPEGLQSRITCFEPAAPGDGRSAVYVDAHDASAITDGALVLTWLLQRGWRVCGVDMPLEGANAIDITPVREGHDDLDRTIADDGALLGYFLAPMAAAVNWLMDSRPAAAQGRPPLLVAGRSAGGLLACLYGALDSRVDVVVDLAGCFPMSTLLDPLPFDTTGEGGNHLENSYPPLADQVPDVAWILAGGSKANLHFYSLQDPCCARYHHEHPWIRYLRAQGTTDRRVRFRLGGERVHGLTPAGLEELDRLLGEALNNPLDASRDGP